MACLLPLAGGILASFDNWPSPMKSVQKNVQTLTLSVEIVLLAPGGSLAGFWNDACQSATPLSLMIFWSSRQGSAIQHWRGSAYHSRLHRTYKHVQSHQGSSSKSLWYPRARVCFRIH